MTASVLDVVQFAALPIETQELCQRVYGGTPEEIDELRELVDGADKVEDLRGALKEIIQIAESA